MTNRNFFINAVGMVSFDGHESIPTAIRYRTGEPNVIGVKATNDTTAIDGLNEDFKIDLGNFKPGKELERRKRVICGDGESRSTYNIARDYFTRLREEAAEHLQRHGMQIASNLLISEPLSFYAEEQDDWLENYRGNLRRILGGMFQSIEFMPEPFAVYQYYRYGMRHAVVAQERKHCALVIDFGGGTFDASVVETTNAGDISQAGRHARPLGARSRAVGGFEINRVFAKTLLTTAFAKKPTKERETLERGLANYYRVRKGDLAFDDLSPSNQTFLRWLGRFLHEIEAAKIELSRKITDWRLDTALTEAVTVHIPENPFIADSGVMPIRVSGEILRGIVTDELWKGLRQCVRSTLDCAKKDLQGRPIDVILLSGGSANLRWLEWLLKRDFDDDLARAHMVSLRESYQEVVAKGLAIECARRGYTEDSEFSDVTYNPLYLVLDPDTQGLQIKAFKLTHGPEGIEEPIEPGELMPSAEALETEDELELEWKTRLDHPPKHHLDYFFTRGSLDPEILEDRYNVVQTRVPTPLDTQFKGPVRIRLRFRSDGTCAPRFIYRTDKSGAPLRYVDGEAFCIDLVSANRKVRRHAFIGIDFGTASSAVSYVDWKQIETFQDRSKEEIWLELNDLIDLPTPIAVPLKGMLGAVGPANVSRLAMEALEGMLCLAAFATWAEGSARGDVLPRCFNGYWKRSAGPIKKLLLDVIDGGASGPIATTFRKRLTTELRAELDAAIRALDEEKHGKRPVGAYDAKGLLRAPRQCLQRGSRGLGVRSTSRT